jgi:type IV pilus assembly protein PilV
MNRTIQFSACDRQRGFGMIEALVAMVVLSVALLGLAGLQAAGARANYNAYLQSQATMVAMDMFERVRGNPNGNYVIAMNDGLPVGAADCVGVGANCVPDTLARYDIMFMKCALGLFSGADACINRNFQGQLPQGDGSIAVNGNDYTLTIQWFDSADNANKTFVFNATI